MGRHREQWTLGGWAVDVSFLADSLSGKCQDCCLWVYSLLLPPPSPQSRVSITTMILHHHHQSLNREGRWSTTDVFATSFLHFCLFSTALWDLPNSRPVHSLMLSSHLFLCLPCLLPPFTVPCKMVLVESFVCKKKKMFDHRQPPGLCQQVQD